MARRTLAALVVAACAHTATCHLRGSQPQGSGQPLIDITEAVKGMASAAEPYLVEADSEVFRLPSDKPSKFWGSDTSKNVFGVHGKQNELEGGFAWSGGSDKDSNTHALGGMYYNGLKKDGMKPGDWRIAATNTSPSVAKATVFAPSADGVNYHSIQAKGTMGHLTNEQLAVPSK
mmetsp:Transcript_54149/g.121716  ORF Transcript_54149/g.121716 Transcript_54149/m.121716 type:complete len:175 (-) Transcript_54149:100-624(-)